MLGGSEADDPLLAALDDGRGGDWTDDGFSHFDSSNRHNRPLVASQGRLLATRPGGNRNELRCDADDREPLDMDV